MKPHEQARAWRLARKLTVQQLADMTGYSKEAIYRFEHGTTGSGGPHSAWALHRYRMCCAGVDRHLKTGKDFEW